MKYYDYIASSYNKLHKNEQLNKIKIILANYDITKKKILDVGCWTCYMIDYLEKQKNHQEENK